MWHASPRSGYRRYHYFTSYTGDVTVASESHIRYYRCLHCGCTLVYTLIARFMGPTWDPSGADRTQMGPLLVPWTLLSGYINTTSCTLKLHAIILIQTEHTHRQHLAYVDHCNQRHMDIHVSIYACTQMWWYIYILSMSNGGKAMDSKRAIRRRKGVQHRPTKYLRSGNSDNGVRNQSIEYIQDGFSDEGKISLPILPWICYIFILSTKQNLVMSNTLKCLVLNTHLMCS